MFKLNLVLATVLLCFVFGTAQVMPNSEIGKVTLQVPLLANGKPVVTVDANQVEVAHVVEIVPGKVTTEEVVVPPVVMKPMPMVRNTRAIVETGVPNPGMPNRGVPNPGMPNPGMPNPGMPNPGMPNPGVPNPGMPNPGMPNPGMPNPGVSNAAASELHPVAVLPPSSTDAPIEMPKTMPSRSCHQLLLAELTTTPMPMPPPPVENCDQVCTKLELNPICAHNGVCLHEFPNQCIMDTFNCKHRDLAFRVVDENVCRMGLCARRCKAEDLM